MNVFALLFNLFNAYIEEKLCISSYKNKKVLSPFYHKKFIFDRKWMQDVLIFYQKYFLW